MTLGSSLAGLALLLVAVGSMAVPARGASMLPPAARAAAMPFSPWTLHTIGGTGLQRSDAADGDTATAAHMHPTYIAVLADGTIAWFPWNGRRVRTMAPDGRVGTLAGTGRRGFGGDGGPATAARLSDVRDIGAPPEGGALIVDGERVRRVDVHGVITTVAGTGKTGFAGDGGPAVAARFDGLSEVAALPDGGFVVSDIGNERVRKVDKDGTITTIAGTGASGSAGDGGPARLAQLNMYLASGLSVAADGAVLVGEWGNHAIRRISPDGTITRIAGTGKQIGPGGPRPAVRTALDGPVDILPLPDGSVLVSDQLRLRHIGPDGVLREQRMPGCANRADDDPLVIEGTNIFVGAGRPAGCASLGGALARMPDGSIIVSEQGRMRMIASPFAVIPAAAITDTAVRRRSLTLRLSTTLNGSAHLRISRHGHAAATVTAPVHPGANRIELKRRLAPGVYRLRLWVRDAAGRAATDWVAVLVGRLPIRTARRAANNYLRWLEDPNFGRCRRVSDRRVDCISRYLDTGGCFQVFAIAAEHSGLVGFRRYSCRANDRTPFRRRPHWTIDFLNRHISAPPFHRPGTVPAPLAG